MHHKDWDASNNHVDNLEWMSHGAMMSRSRKENRITPPRGENHANAKLRDSDVAFIRSIKGMWPAKIKTEFFSISHVTVYRIFRGVIRKDA